MNNYFTFCRNLTVVAALSFSLIPLDTNAATPQPTSSKTLYVATNGSDRNPGTLQQPLLTLQQAVNQANPGTTIYLRGGTHYLPKSVWIGDDRSGKPNAPVVIRSYQSEKPILDGSKTPKDNHCITIGGQYIDLIGLECRNSTGGGFVVWGGTNIRMLNNKVHDTQGTGMVAYGSRSQDNKIIRRANNILMEDNEVYRTNLENKARQKNGGWGQGIQGMFADNVTIVNNKVYNNYGEGIGCVAASNCVARGNTVYDNYSVQMYMDNAINSTFERNLIYNTGNKEFFRNGNPSSGIQLANESYGTWDYVLNNNIIRNNIVIGGSAGIFYGSYDGNKGVKNTLIANNTFYKATGPLVFLDQDDDNRNVTLVNNIFYQADGKPMTYIPNTNGYKFQRNLWFGGDAGKAASADDVKANPMLVKAGGNIAADYKLQNNSPAIDKGVAQQQVVNDYFGFKRPVGKGSDIGASEFGGK